MKAKLKNYFLYWLYEFGFLFFSFVGGLIDFLLGIITLNFSLQRKINCISRLGHSFITKQLEILFNIKDKNKGEVKDDKT